MNILFANKCVGKCLLEFYSNYFGNFCSWRCLPVKARLISDCPYNKSTNLPFFIVNATLPILIDVDLWCRVLCECLITLSFMAITMDIACVVWLMIIKAMNFRNFKILITYIHVWSEQGYKWMPNSPVVVVLILDIAYVVWYLIIFIN